MTEETDLGLKKLNSVIHPRLTTGLSFHFISLFHAQEPGLSREHNT
jgi:hypothetical protein